MASTLAPQRSAGIGLDTRGQVWRRIVRNRKAVVGGTFLLIIVLAAIFADVVAVHDPAAQNLRNRLQPPSAEHWLGTDQFGRDMFSRIVHGARISLRVGFISVGLALLAGGTMGLLAGYYGGWMETVFMRLVDILLALPSFLLALAIVSTLGPSLTNVMIAVGIAYTPGFARVMRSSVLSVRQLDYVAAAQAAGASDLRIMFRHVLPNAMVATLTFLPFILSGSIVALVSLDFLGFGLPPGSPSLGELLNQGKSNLQAPWLGITSFLVIALILTLLVFIGEAVRDAFDPRKVFK